MSNTRLINDWRPEVNSFIKRLTDAGFSIVKQNNGEETTKYDPLNHDKFVLECIACDEFGLYVKHPKNEKNTWISCILGNSPGEMPSDWTIPSNEEAAKALDEVCSKHGDEWEVKPQPKTEEVSFYALYKGWS